MSDPAGFPSVASGDANAEEARTLRELVSKLTAANESMTQDRDREAKKAKLLERELLALRASTEQLRQYQGMQIQQDEQLAQLLREKTEECEQLRRELQESRGTSAQLDLQLREALARLQIAQQEQAAIMSQGRTGFLPANAYQDPSRHDPFAGGQLPNTASTYGPSATKFADATEDEKEEQGYFGDLVFWALGDPARR
ncbi:unnamed protein product [Amoebophrya sp. A120]|nr:unnamed protein product [Amoebophrya sp. A120]|eukprot:GSA120T00006219001.1